MGITPYIVNIATTLAFLNSATDAPHLLIEFIQGTPTSLILLLDLIPRKDSVLHPEYLDEYYSNTVLDKVRRDLEELPQISLYRSPSLFIRGALSPTADTVRVDCESEGDLEEIEIDLVANLPRLFGDDVADRIVEETKND